ncbi:MAG: hypothetical protein Q8R25_03280, partial [bacterium]|nr:hypothetical protein [bacterium]
MENPDKNRRKKQLGIVGTALLGALATEPTDAGAQKTPEAKTLSQAQKNTARSPMEELNWFTSKIGS